MSDGLRERKRAAILGALVGDAASMGFHWLYDQTRIRELNPSAPEFRQPDRRDYEGVSGYFAHATKNAGELSHYGEQAKLMLQSLSSCPEDYSQRHYQALFHQFFGYGGAYVGYIDHATRDTLNRMEEAGTALQESPEGTYFGSNDLQLPAVSKLPALVARFAGDTRLAAVTESAVRVTNNVDVSVEYGLVAARAIEAAILTASPVLAIEAGLRAASERIAVELQPAEERKGLSSAEFSAALGLSCELKFGVPSVFHQLRDVASFAGAIRENIWIGGDSCGRAILLGSVLGACFGVGGELGIPEPWVARLPERKKIDLWIDQML